MPVENIIKLLDNAQQGKTINETVHQDRINGVSFTLIINNEIETDSHLYDFESQSTVFKYYIKFKNKVIVKSNYKSDIISFFNENL